MCKKQENIYLVSFLFITFIASTNIFASKIVWVFDIFLDCLFFLNFLSDSKVVQVQDKFKFPNMSNEVEQKRNNHWKRLFKFYPILIFVFSSFWCIQSFKTQLDENTTWIPNVLISALQIDILF